MPVHDWTKVAAGTFHDLHVAWIPIIKRVLNAGLLPQGYYAMSEQVSGQIVPDVLTLQDTTPAGEDWKPTTNPITGGAALATSPPRVTHRDSISEAALLAARRRQLVIRHNTGDRIVAILEVVSPGNKEKRSALETFVDKAIGAMEAGYHLVVLDLLPPGPGDPAGMHDAIWRRLGGRFDPPPDKPLTLASYAVSRTIDCYVEPAAVGSILADLPLFLSPDRYVNLPLESTYMEAFDGMPPKWKHVLSARA